MNIVIAGGTGFVGQETIRLLNAEGYKLFVLTRNPNKYKADPRINYVEWLNSGSFPEKMLPQIDAVINLAGESLNRGRWTPEQKRKILSSRLDTTKEIQRIIKELPEKPKVLINASAIGCYGTSLNKTFDERSLDKGSDFLAETVQSWEAEAIKAEEQGVRTVLTRFGLVLGKDGGALPKMLLPYRLYIGGKIGSGRQWMSWIHVADAARAILFFLHNHNLKGAFNLTSPNPVTMNELGKTIGRVMGRPHWLPVPDFALRLGLGEMSLLVLEGQKVIPGKLLSANFQFTYPFLPAALEDILK